MTLVSLLGHGPTTQHGAEALTAVDPPKIDDYSSVGGRRAVCCGILESRCVPPPSLPLTLTLTWLFVIVVTP